MLSIAELFLRTDDSFSRLPVWVKNSKVLEHLADDDEDEWVDSLNYGILTVPVLNSIWNILIGNSIVLHDCEFMDVYHGANYLDMDRVLRELCLYYIHSGYQGPLWQEEDIVWMNIMHNKMLMWKWFEVFIDEMRTGITRLWHPKLFWEGKYASYPRRSGWEQEDTCEIPMHEITHWHAFWNEMSDKQLDNHVIPFLFDSGIIPMLGIFPLPYAYCPIAGHSHGRLVSGNHSAKFMEMPGWMVKFILACPDYILQVYKGADSIIVTWMRSGLLDFVEKSMIAIPNNWRCAAGYSLIDYAAVNGCEQRIIDILFQSGHCPTYRVWSGILETAIVRRHFIGPWVYWMSLMFERGTLPRMPSSLMTHFASTFGGDQNGNGVNLHAQLNTLYQIAMEEEKRNDSISLDSIHLNA